MVFFPFNNCNENHNSKNRYMKYGIKNAITVCLEDATSEKSKGDRKTITDSIFNPLSTTNVLNIDSGFILLLCNKKKISAATVTK